MKSNGIAAVLVFLSLGRTGCGRDTSDPTPLPTPYGTPNATAFENLDLVRTLERNSGRTTVLVVIDGAHTALDGRLVASGGWDYGFAEHETSPVYDWAVFASGQVVFEGSTSNVARLGITEIGPFLTIDSPEAIRLGREFGAQAFVDRYPGGYLSMNCRFLGGRAVWEMYFNHPTAGCRLGPIVIDAQTGQLLYRDLYCLNRTS